jgi:steroid 5-alpha reductase family enzyme
MSAAASLKQIFWLLAIGREELTPGASAAVGIFNGAFNSLNALLFLWSATSPFSSFSTSLGLPLPAPMLAGAALFTLGIALETLPEIQRKRFKENPANKGKVCDAGVWGWVRHPNYGGYALWRTGYALAAGGLAFGLVMGAWQMWHFATDSVVFMDEYMQKRYGEQWEGHKKRVRWLLVPGIY